MTAPAHTTLLARARRVLADRRPAGDVDLLRRFAATGEEEAFAQLVDTHAPLVWGVCRRGLANPADREDVFQATFLALVRQAPALDLRRPLAPWLYAVARRAARKAAVRGFRRRTQPLPDVAAAEVGDPVAGREVCRAIDEEVERLPRTLREAVVACCIQGEARGDAAAALGCTEAAVKARLERARGRLRAALRRRGVELPAALTLLFLGSDRVSAGLVERTVALAHGSVPASVAALAKAGLSLAVVGSVLAAPVAVVCCLAVVTAALRTPPAAQAQPQPPAAAAKPAAKPAPLVDGWGDPLPAGAVRRFGTTRLRQPYPHAVQFTPDGKTLVAGSGSDPLGVFDAATGRKLRDVGEHSSNNPYGFRLTPDGKQAICLGYNVTRWDLATGALVQRYAVGRCSSLAVAPDGKSFAVLLERQPALQHVDLGTGRVMAETKLPTEETYESRLEFDAAGTTVFVQAMALKALKDGQYRVEGLPLRVWDTVANALRDVPLPITGAAPADFALLPGTTTLAYAVEKGPVAVWDAATQKAVRTLTPADAAATGLAASGDGRRLAVRTKRTIAVLDAASGKSVLSVAVEPTRSGYVVFGLSPDGKRLACASRLDSLVRVWDVDAGTEVLPDSGHCQKPEFDLSADGKTVISRASDEDYHWDRATGKGVRKPKPAPPPPVFGNKTTGTLWDVTVDDNKNRLVVTDKAGREIAAWATPKQNCRGVAISDDGRHLAVSFQDRLRTVLLWTPAENKEPFVLTGHPDACQRLAFSHDGRTLFAAAGTHNFYKQPVNFLYDVATGQRRHTLACNSSPGHVAFTADDRVLVTGGLWNDAITRVWDAGTGEQLAALADPTLRLTTEAGNPTALASIEGVQLSPDERLLAVMSGVDDQSSLAVWEVGTWKLVKSFPPTGPRSRGATLRFSRDGQSLFAANPDTTILEWDVSGRFGTAPPPALSPRRLDQLAARLGERDGYPAVWELAAHPAQAVALFRGPLAPGPKPAAKDVAAWIAALDAPAFQDRDAAGRSLLAQGDHAVRALEAAAKGALTAEAADRVEALLKTLRAGTAPVQLRQRRMVAVLEFADDAGAKALLTEYAKGDAGDRLTRAARKALPAGRP